VVMNDLIGYDLLEKIQQTQNIFSIFDTLSFWIVMFFSSPDIYQVFGRGESSMAT